MATFMMSSLLEYDGETENEYRYVETGPLKHLGPILVSKNALGQNPPQELMLTLEEPREGEVEIDLDEP